MPTVGQASRTTISHPHAGNCPVKPKSTLHPKIIYCRCTIAPLPKQHNTSEASNAWAGSSFIIPIQPKPQKPPPPHQSHPNTTPKTQLVTSNSKLPPTVEHTSARARLQPLEIQRRKPHRLHHKETIIAKANFSFIAADNLHARSARINQLATRPYYLHNIILTDGQSIRDHRAQHHRCSWIEHHHSFEKALGSHKAPLLLI